MPYAAGTVALFKLNNNYTDATGNQTATGETGVSFTTSEDAKFPYESDPSIPGSNSAPAYAAAFDGTGGALSIAASSDFYFAGDFTFDFWVLFSSFPGGYGNEYTILKFADNTFFITLHGNRGLCAYSSTSLSSGVEQGAFSGWSASTWYHIALVRYGNNLTLYRDGVQLAQNTSFTTSWGKTNQNILLGPALSGYQNLYGRIDEFRISDRARWTAAFTPPTTPYYLVQYVYASQSDRIDLRKAQQAIQADNITINRNTVATKQTDKINIRTWQQASQVNRLGVRTEQQSRINDRLTVRAYQNFISTDRITVSRYIYAQQYARHHTMIKEGWGLYEDDILLGSIDAETATYADINLAEGVHEIEIRPRRWFWESRLVQKIVVMVGANGLIESLIPPVTDLELSYAFAKTKISFVYPGGAGTAKITGFAAWYSDVSPVDTSGLPNDRIILNGVSATGKRAFYRALQTGTEYAAICAYSGTEYGTVTEITLPDIGDTPVSSNRQFAKEAAL